MPADALRRFQLRCDTRLHKVALDPARYWKSTRCPACRQTLDRYRLRRLKKWLTGEAPRSAVRAGPRIRITAVEMIALLWTAVVASVALTLHTVADRWWPATILLFLGRWPWLMPGIIALGLALIARSQRAMLIGLAGVLICLVGVMELSLGLGRIVPSGDSDTESPIRVITYNTDGDAVPPSLIMAILREWQPDILALQECGIAVREQMENLKGYHTDLGTTCLITRFPIIAIDSMRRDAFANAGGAAWVKRYRLKGTQRAFDFTNLHLDTPRKAFEALLDGRDSANVSITDKTDVRNLESRLARRWVDLGPGPRLVAGDFNMPTESAIFRDHWRSMTDGFEQAGRGFGYTRLAGWISLRIDHVLADDAWVVSAARVLPDYGSDHLPVMVDLQLKTPGR